MRARERGELRYGLRPSLHSPRLAIKEKETQVKTSH